MTSRSNPDWLAELVAQDGDTQLIDADERDALVAAITAANSPKPLDPRRHEQLLDVVLGRQGDPLASPGQQELVRAATVMSDPLVATLQAAYAPLELSPEVENIVRDSAIGRPHPAVQRLRPRLAATLWGVLSIAAIAVIWITTSRGRIDGLRPNHRAEINFMPARSTGSMFAEPFANSTASERIDRIAQARQRDLRENRYLLWGLR